MSWINPNPYDQSYVPYRYWPCVPYQPIQPFVNPPGIKAIEYNPDGTIKRIEYFPPSPDPLDTTPQVTC